jgi:cell division protein FtsQ
MKRKAIYIVVWTLLIIALAVVLGFIVRRHGSSKCSGVQILMHYPADDFLVTKQDIQQYIDKMGDSLKGEPLSYIDIEQLEKMILANPYVSHADVYMTLDGIVTIDVAQRKAIVRVQNYYNECFYISDDGCIMPINPGKPAYVPIASGQIREIRNYDLKLNIDTLRDTTTVKTTLYRIYKLAEYIACDTFLNAQIAQIYIDKNNEFELFPLVGRQVILFGDADNMAEKFGNLLVFYKQGLAMQGWEKYDTINLKFHNQVVATNIEKTKSYGR